MTTVALTVRSFFAPRCRACGSREGLCYFGHGWHLVALCAEHARLVGLLRRVIDWGRA